MQFHPANFPGPRQSSASLRSPSPQARDAGDKILSPAQQYHYERARQGLVGGSVAGSSSTMSNSATADNSSKSRPPFNALSRHSSASGGDSTGSVNRARSNSLASARGFHGTSRNSRRAASPAPSASASLGASGGAMSPHGAARSDAGNRAAHTMRSSSAQSFGASASGDSIPFAKGQRVSPRVYGASTTQSSPGTGVVSVSPSARKRQERLHSRADYVPPRESASVDSRSRTGAGRVGRPSTPTGGLLLDPDDDGGVEVDHAPHTPWHEAFSSKGKRYFFNVVTRKSTYREPVTYIPYAGQ